MVRNSELIAELQKHPLDEEVIVFAEGALYPTECISLIDLDGSPKIEIACGWTKYEDSDG